MTYTVGSLVKARGSEWVVLGPLGGTEDEEQLKKE
jgi:hypothetical protein